MPVTNINSRRELFTDQSLVESTFGDISFRLHHPVPREVINEIEDEYRCPYRYMTVFQDVDIYRMYYALVDPARVNAKDTKHPERICYAESRDGIHWEKPVLGFFEYKGNSQNNIIWMENESNRFGVGGFSPFKDTNPDCAPEHRYKAIAEVGPAGKRALNGNGLVALSSPDGLHWSMLSSGFVVKPGSELSGFDSQNLAFRDNERNEYRLYRRASFREGPLNVCRDIVTYTSTDFINWGKGERLQYPGAAPEQLYTNNIIPYFRAPHLFVGFPARYVQRVWSDAFEDLPEPERRKALIRKSGAEPVKTDPTAAGGQRIGTSLTDTLFMSSRDGVSFHRQPEAFLRPGLRTKNNWFYPDNFPAWGMLATPSDIEDAPDELSFYVSEGCRREGMSNICRRYSLRMDGFVSAHTSGKGGELMTSPLIFSGSDLYINFSASAAGSIKIELQDERGWPLPGFGLDECVELLGDDLNRRVRWRSDLSQLAGVPIKVLFKMVDADLYSFRFGNRNERPFGGIL